MLGYFFFLWLFVAHVSSPSCQIKSKSPPPLPPSLGVCVCVSMGRVVIFDDLFFLGEEEETNYLSV